MVASSAPVQATASRIVSVQWCWRPPLQFDIGSICLMGIIIWNRFVKGDSHCWWSLDRKTILHPRMPLWILYTQCLKQPRRGLSWRKPTISSADERKTWWTLWVSQQTFFFFKIIKRKPIVKCLLRCELTWSRSCIKNPQLFGVDDLVLFPELWLHCTICNGCFLIWILVKQVTGYSMYFLSATETWAYWQQQIFQILNHPRWTHQ